MAYVINPDGTITTVPADYDRNGNLSIKRGYSFSEGVGNQNYYTPTTAPKQQSSRKKPSRKKKVAKTTAPSKNYDTPTTAPTQQSSWNTPSSKKKVTNTTAPSEKKVSKTILLGESSSSSSSMPTYQIHAKRKKRKPPYFVSKAEVNFFFDDIIAKQKVLTREKFKEIRVTLNIGLAIYFTNCYKKYLEQYSHDEEPSIKKSKKGKKAKQKHTKKENSIPTAQSYPHHPGRKPVYGYARDRFGRVQERDSFNEEKRNEFYQATNSQRRYDYSSYDANDDHDGAYSGWE